MDPVQQEPEQVSQQQSDELKVTFFPELFLQRRIWILNILRKENVSAVLDVGCGEGQLLGTLCRPAPWLRPPPPEILSLTPSPTPTQSPTGPAEQSVPPSPIYNDDDIPNLHIHTVYGLDISTEDLKFAVEDTAPPVDAPDETESPGFRSYVSGVQRWEGLMAKIWHGGLEVINEEFVDIECIVSTEVIEHLPTEILPAFAPMLLGVYHPTLLLITTPSYTYNARFTAPDAPPSARKGYPDPTGRTDRIFRHNDHKFEWTREEFVTWCEEAASEWGYVVDQTSIGRSLLADPYGRDEKLEGASNVAVFRRSDAAMSIATRETKGRTIIKELALTSPSHTLLAVQQHAAHPASMKPHSLSEIAACVKSKMEEYREAFMRVEELWYEKEIAVLCGGWIELLVRAVEQSTDLDFKRESDSLSSKRSTNWSVQLVGGVAEPTPEQWPNEFERESSVDYIPRDWIPGEGPYENWYESLSDKESTGAEGDVSAYASDADGDEESDGGTSVGWGRPSKGWNTLAYEDQKGTTETIGWAKSEDWAVDDHGWVTHGAISSSAGWDGDESCETTS